MGKVPAWNVASRWRWLWGSQLSCCGRKRTAGGREFPESGEKVGVVKKLETVKYCWSMGHMERGWHEATGLLRGHISLPSGAMVSVGFTWNSSRTRASPSSSLPMSLWEEEIRTHRETRDVWAQGPCEEREKGHPEARKRGLRRTQRCRHVDFYISLWNPTRSRGSFWVCVCQCRILNREATWPESCLNVHPAAWGERILQTISSLSKQYSLEKAEIRISACVFKAIS